MEVVQDVDRPDVNGTPPKMLAICDAIREATLAITPVIKVSTNDNIMSSVKVTGSFDPRDTWQNGIYENSCFYRFLITPQKGKRYYDTTDEKVTIELASSNASYLIDHKHRKYTGPVDRVIKRLQDWLKKGQELRNQQRKVA